MTDNTPREGQSFRVTCTGYANAVQAPGAKAHTVAIQARQAITGLSGGDLTDNAGPVLVYFQKTAPVNGGVPATMTTALILAAGQSIVLNVEDTGYLWFYGQNNDSVNITVLF